MATVTHRITTASTTNTTSYASGAFTPAAGELLVVFVVATGTLADDTILQSSQSLGFNQVFHNNKSAAADSIYCFTATKFATAVSQTVTFTCNSDAATGAVIFVAGVSGMTRVGHPAIAQYVGIDSQAASATPVFTFGGNVSTGNPTLGIIANVRNPAAMTPPTGWTEQADTGFLTPTLGAEYVSRDSGYTGNTMTWGNTTGGAWGGMCIELDTTAAPAISTLVDTFSTGSVPDAATWNYFGAGSTTVSGGRLNQSPLANTLNDDNEVHSNLSYDLTGGQIMVEVPQVTVADQETSLNFQPGVFLTRAMIAQENGTLSAFYAVSDGNFVTVGFKTYDPVAMRWWRIREFGGTMYWDYSPNAFEWFNLGTAANPFAVTSGVVVLIAYENTSQAAPGTSQWDNINTMPSAPTYKFNLNNRGLRPRPFAPGLAK
jgi:hypothetical protein